jgi:zinc resistance-associated protein
MKRAHKLLTFTALGAGLLAASAFAQQPPSSQSPAAAPPAQPQAAPSQAASPSADQRGPRGVSSEDRAAYFDAHLAAIHAGLKLTADQERLWPPVESAARDMVKQMMQLRDQRQSQAAPADPVERMARMGEASTRRGQVMTRLAEAARPLYASLTDDQKRRLRTLMRHPGHDGERGMMGRGGDRGHGRHHHHMDGGGREERGDMRGMRGGDMWGGDMRGDGPRGRDMDRDMGRGRDDRGGRWNDWR